MKDADLEPIYLTWLNGLDIERLAITDEEILDAVEAGLLAQGRGQTVIEPRVHLIPDPAFSGHFNVLRGYIAPMNHAGVKIVGDYVDNYRRGLPSEMALLNLFDPRTGMPQAILDATAITEMRTGAMTALGAKHLARRDSKVLGHIGARGTAYWNVRLLDRLFDFDEIRVHSRRPESRDAFARALAQRSRQAGRAVATAGRNASRAPTSWWRRRGWRRPSRCSRPSGSSAAAFVVPYGTMSAVELSLTDIMDKIVVDDWGQCRAGPVRLAAPPRRDGAAFGSDAPCRALRDRRRRKPGRESDDGDDPVLAPRAFAQRHRARPRHARQGGGAWASARSSASPEREGARPRAPGRRDAAPPGASPQYCTPRVSAPSTTRFVPVMKLAAGLARNATAFAISCGVPMRPVGFSASAVA